MYKESTEVLGIPVPGHEKLRPEVEKIKYQAIENQLLAGMKGMRSCVFEEGRYVLSQDTDTEYMVSLLAVGERLPFAGIVGCLYAEEKTELVWEGLKSGERYWLYVTPGPKMLYEKSDIRTVTSQAPLDTMNGRYLLLATVDLVTENAVNSSPEGKIYSAVVVGHTHESKDPHGSELTQTILTLLSKLQFAIAGGSDAVITVRDERDVQAPTIDSNTEIVLKDKRLMVSVSDADNEALLTDSQSLVGAINELHARLQSLEE